MKVYIWTDHLYLHVFTDYIMSVKMTTFNKLFKGVITWLEINEYYWGINIEMSTYYWVNTLDATPVVKICFGDFFFLFLRDQII
jgi:hypothetical protein